MTHRERDAMYTFTHCTHTASLTHTRRWTSMPYRQSRDYRQNARQVKRRIWSQGSNQTGLDASSTRGSPCGVERWRQNIQQQRQGTRKRGVFRDRVPGKRVIFRDREPGKGGYSETGYQEKGGYSETGYQEKGGYSETGYQEYSTDRASHWALQGWSRQNIHSDPR